MTVAVPMPGSIGQRKVVQRRRSLVWAMALFVYLLLIPHQIYLVVGSAVIPPYRLFMVAGAFFAGYCIFSGRLRLHLADIPIAVAGLWIFASLWITSGADRAIFGGGAALLDMVVSYLFARCCFSGMRDLRILLIILAPGLLFTGLLLALESTTHTHLLQTFVGSSLGFPVKLQSVFRLGLMRAYGPFPHPILAGLFLANFLIIYAHSGIRGWPKFSGIVASICAFFSLSSAALLVLVSNIALATLHRLVEWISNLYWRVVLAGLAVVIFVVEMATGSGVVGLVIRFASLNTASASYRQLIWAYGSASVERHPWFGIGFAEWERPEWLGWSIDNYWLMLAIQYGVIVPFSILLGVAIVIGLATRSLAYLGETDRQLMVGLIIALIVFTGAIFTVALWLAVQAWFYAMIGMIVSLALSTSRQVTHGPPQQTADGP